MNYDFASMQKQVDEALRNPRYYTDFSDVDPNVLHQMSELLEFIRTKGNGAALREAVAQLFERYILTSAKEGNANLEVSLARGNSSTLADRLELILAEAQTGVISMDRLSQEVKQAMTGGSVAVVGKDAVNGIENIVDGTVTPDNLIDHALYMEKGANLFNLATATAGQYVSFENGQLRPSTAGYYASDFIRVKPSTQYTKNDDGQQVAFYDASKTFISGQASGVRFTTPSNAAYVRLTVLNKHLNTMMLVGGANVGHFEPYVVKLDRGTIERMSPLESPDNAMVYTEASRNLFDKDKATRGGYIHYQDGGWRTQSLYSVSDYIPVEPSGWYTKNDAQQVVFFDATKKFISGVPAATTFQVPANAYFMRVAIATASIDTLQIEVGQKRTAFCEYGGLKIDRDKMEMALSKQVQLKFLLPSKIRIYRGQHFDIYFDGVLKYYQEFQKGNYYVTAQTVTTGTDAVLKGKIVDNKWFYKPTATEVFKIRFRVVETFTETTIDEQDVEFTVVEKPTGSLNIVTIGDSFTDGYGITKRVAELMEADGLTSNFIGLHDTGKDGVKDDAWAGWSWEHFSRGASGYKRTDRPDSGATSTVNQFYNPTTKKFDFAYYMSTYQPGKTVDTVIINLGLNDVQQKTIATVKQKMGQSRSDVQAILDSIKAYSPTIKIFVGLVPKQTSDNAFISSYSTTYNNSERLNHNVELFNEMLLEMETMKNVYIMPTNANFDRENSYLTTNLVTNQMSDVAVARASDIHPNPTGTEYISRTIYQALSVAF